MDTITSSVEISSLFEHGKRVQSPSITFIVSTQHDRTSSMGGRAAFIAGKRSGNAVWRNAAKRRMRAVCRECGGVPNGVTMVLLAKGNIMKRSYQDVLRETRRVFERLGEENEGERR